MAFRGMQIEIAAAGHRAFTANVECGQCIDLAGIRFTDSQPELLLHRRIGRGRLHATEFERWTFIFVEIG